MSKIRVLQAVNTSDYDNIQGRSCIDYWSDNATNNRDANYCRATDERGDEDNPIVGGHVIAVINGRPHIYITPILNNVNLTRDPAIFKVDTEDLAQVPTDDENAILADIENQKLVSALIELDRIDNLMGNNQ